jgi:hypothetical protein
VTTWRLDVHFVIPVCKACHVRIHRAWREWGFDAITNPALARVRRLQVLFVRDEPILLSPDVCRGIVACLGRVAEALESRCR